MDRERVFDDNKTLTAFAACSAALAVLMAAAATLGCCSLQAQQRMTLSFLVLALASRPVF